ncbi:MAG: sugar phosphate isomerase/epimerase family protein [Anaerolineae bacterium]
MGDIKLAGAAWSFVGASLAESAGILRALGIQAMDLLAAPGALLDSHEIERDLAALARRVTEPGIELSNLIYTFGAGFVDRAVNSADKAIRTQNVESFKWVLEFCIAAGIPSVTILPGVDQPGLSHQEALQLSGEAMTELTAMGREARVLLVFEPHIHSILESPFETLAFLQQNPTLKMALDYSHFVAQGYKPADVDPLVPYTGHVHLRQGAHKQLQARWDEGEIDFARVIGLLKQAGYKGYVTLEYEHDTSWMDMDKVDVMTETIKMRDLVKPLL